jgi:hypothetical protein
MGLGWQDKKKALWQSLPGLGPEVVGQNLRTASGASRRQGIVGEVCLIQGAMGVIRRAAESDAGIAFPGHIGMQRLDQGVLPIPASPLRNTTCPSPA